MDHEHASTRGRTFRHTWRAVLIAVLALGLALTGGASAGRATADSGTSPSVASTPFMAVFSGKATAAPGGRCPALTATATISGVGTTYGQFTSQLSQCIDPNGSDPFAFTDGTFLTTTANGDTTFGTYSGRLRPTATSSADNLYLVYGEYIFTGGTGAWAGISGGGTATGVYNLATGDFSYSLSGVIGVPGITQP